MEGNEGCSTGRDTLQGRKGLQDLAKEMVGKNHVKKEKKAHTNPERSSLLTCLLVLHEGSNCGMIASFTLKINIHSRSLAPSSFRISLA